MRNRNVALSVCCLLLFASLAAFTPNQSGAAVPRGPGRSSGFLTVYGTSGSQPGGTVPNTYFNTGMNVYLDRGMRHTKQIQSAIAYAVKQMDRYGLQIYYKGVVKHFGDEPGTSGDLGVITVHELTSQRGACGHATLPNTVLEGITFPSPIKQAGIRVFELSGISFCPDVFTRGRAALIETALHELGHAVGLGHYVGTFHGRQQVMAPVRPTPIPTTYQPGDVNGLRWLAYEQHRLQRLSALRGAVEKWAVAGHVLQVSGWALTGVVKAPTNIYLTMDGKLIATDSTGYVSRPDIAAKYHAPYRKAGFQLTNAAADGPHQYCILIANNNAPTHKQSIGCKTLTGAAPSSSSPTPVVTGGATGHASLAPAAGSSGGSGLGAGPIIAIAAAVVVAGALTWLLLARRRPSGHAAAPGQPGPGHVPPYPPAGPTAPGGPYPPPGPPPPPPNWSPPPPRR